MAFHPMAETPLTQAFLEDHRTLTRGLDQLREAVVNDDFRTAKHLADQLDRSVGGHIEFEERILYPEVALTTGADHVHRLYAEHRAGREAIGRILSVPDTEKLPPDVRPKLLAQLNTVCDHVLSCGTLVSHLASLPAPKQAAILERLLQYRSAGHRWTQLPTDAEPDLACGVPVESVGKRP